MYVFNRTSGTHRVQNEVLDNHGQELQVIELYKYIKRCCEPNVGALQEQYVFLISESFSLAPRFLSMLFFS